MAHPDAKLTASRAIESEVQSLYRRLLDAWNACDANAYAQCFVQDGSLTGFDGSTEEGRDAIRGHLAPIFADHPTGKYVAKVRLARAINGRVALLRAVAGLVPAGKDDINPALNAVQSLVAAEEDGKLGIVLFQNTPARFDGRPQLADQLTAELRDELRRLKPSPPSRG
jgi:uncharacterized protein (TIGR02246 family)